VAQEPSWPLTHALGDGERTLCGLNPFIEKLAATVFPGLVSCEACLLTLAPGSVGEVEERTEEEAPLRTFGIPACPDDLEKVVDAEGEEWTRGTHSRRNKWTSGDGLEIADWRRLVVGYGPVTERAAASAVKGEQQ
jgi:hypothetical protein